MKEAAIAVIDLENHSFQKGAWKGQKMNSLNSFETQIELNSQNEGLSNLKKKIWRLVVDVDGETETSAGGGAGVEVGGRKGECGGRRCWC